MTLKFNGFKAKRNFHTILNFVLIQKYEMYENKYRTKICDFTVKFVCCNMVLTGPVEWEQTRTIITVPNFSHSTGHVYYRFLTYTVFTVSDQHLSKAQKPHRSTAEPNERDTPVEALSRQSDCIVHITKLLVDINRTWETLHWRKGRERERQRETERQTEWVREKEKERECVCMWEKERERDNTKNYWK